MDLTNFLKKNKGEDNKKVFNFKTKEELFKFQNETFFNLSFGKKLNNLKEIKSFLNDAIHKNKTEGIMLKEINSKYKSGIRADTMYKLKETLEDLDLVIIGAEMGTGKRSGFFSSFYIACKNEDYVDEDEKFLIVGKVSSGIKELDEFGISMKNLTNLLSPLKKSFDEKNQITYFTPKIIVQIRYQQIQKSEIYNSKIALRFPRLIGIREDKSLEEINDIEEIIKLTN